MLELFGGNDATSQFGVLQYGTDGRQIPSKKLGSFPVFVYTAWQFTRNVRYLEKTYEEVSTLFLGRYQQEF